MDFVSFSFSTRRLTYLCLVGLLLLITTYVFPTLSTPYLWLTTWLLAILPMRGTYLRHLQAMFLTSILLLLVTFCIIVTSQYFFFASIFIFLLTFFTLYFGHGHKRYAISLIYVVIFGMISNTMMHEGNASHALISVMSGALIAMSGYLIYFPVFHKHRWHRMGYRLCEQLNTVTQTMLDCVLHPDYSYALYTYERRLHLQKMSVMTTLLKFKIESSFTQSNKKQIEPLFERLYASIQDAGLLRIREEDAANFELSSDEFTLIKQSFMDALTQLASMFKDKKLTIDFKQYQEVLERFNGHCHQVLFVTVKQPMIYLYFLTSIQNAFEMIDQIAAIMRED